MVKRSLLAASLLGGLFLASAGCTAMYSEGGPGPQARPAGHGWGWDRGRPRMEVISGTSIQFVVEGNEDIFLYGGAWYRWGGGTWYLSTEEGGAWKRIQEPPAVFYKIPPGHAKYRVVGNRGGPGPKDKDKDDGDKPGRGRGR